MSIYEALQILESTDTVDLRELTDWTEEEYNGAVRTLLREYKQNKKDSEEIITNLEKKLAGIREEFLKYNWQESTNEQIYNQLKEIYDKFIV